MTQAFNLSQLANNVNSSGLLNAAAGLYNQTPVANGGTGVATLTTGSVLLGAGTSAVTTVAAGTAGNVLTSDGTAWVAQIASGGTPIVRIYSSPSPWTKPATLKAVKVTLVGGGASGGGAGGSPAAAGGSGGNGGVLYGYAQAPAIPGPVTATVGSGGAATPGAGNNGGATSFGAVFTVTGGTGGGAGSTGNPGTIGANGGSFTITSAPTTASIQLTAPISSTVGNVLPQSWGIKGSPGSNAGVGYGAGGGAGTSASPVSGAGTAGFIIVEEFY